MTDDRRVRAYVVIAGLFVLGSMADGLMGAWFWQNWFTMRAQVPNLPAPVGISPMHLSDTLAPSASLILLIVVVRLSKRIDALTRRVGF